MKLKEEYKRERKELSGEWKGNQTEHNRKAKRQK
jgi:hypothetical protein